jgi:hypothetical protein
MIPLWKGKNPIYFGVITIIPFDNLYRRAYFVIHTFLIYYLTCVIHYDGFVGFNCVLEIIMFEYDTGKYFLS